MTKREITKDDIEALHKFALSRRTLLQEHVGWLRLYVADMTEANWRDMKLRCERQLDELGKLVDGETATERKK